MGRHLGDITRETCSSVEFASSVRGTCAVSIDVHGLILTDFFAYARTIQETGDGQTKRVVTMQERRTNNSSKPLLNVQQSNPIIHSLNTCSLLLPRSPSWTHLFGYPMASVVLSRTHLFGHPLTSVVLTPPLAFSIQTPNKIKYLNHTTSPSWTSLFGYPIARTVRTHSLALPLSCPFQHYTIRLFSK